MSLTSFVDPDGLVVPITRLPPLRIQTLHRGGFVIKINEIHAHAIKLLQQEMIAANQAELAVLLGQMERLDRDSEPLAVAMSKMDFIRELATLPLGSVPLTYFFRCSLFAAAIHIEQFTLWAKERNQFTLTLSAWYDRNSPETLRKLAATIPLWEADTELN
ncbi:MAG: hypothetical protein ABIS59_03270 [Candidatus Saccharibacteria bacterium]